MDLLKNANIIAAGFLVWLLIAPRAGSPQYGERFMAYMTALLFCLIASVDIMLVKPVAFFFTVGGVLAFTYVIVRLTIRINAKK